MPSVDHKILIVEDVPTLARTYASYLAAESSQIAIVDSGAAALGFIERQGSAVVLLDVNLPDMSGLDVLKTICSGRKTCEVIMITSNGSIGLAVEAMRLGASDFVVKPFTPDRLRIAVRNALERGREAGPVSFSAIETDSDQFCGFVGDSLPMQVIYQTIRSAARSKATVFITGESGTGKELCAQALHSFSPRAGKPFVALNCAAIPRDLLESEMFGHVRGSFTGATSDRMGAILRANGGTLFLDEIGEMEIGFQAKLLRFLETSLVQRIGEDVPQPCDVRIICATNRSPRDEVAAGRFREDLFYRLFVVPLEMPPLRSRGGDILAIASRCLASFAEEDGKVFNGFTAEAGNLLRAYRWPGNVRELRNTLRKIVVLNEGSVVTSDMLPPEIREASGGGELPVAAPLAAGRQNVVAQAATSAVSVSRSRIIPLDESIDAVIEDAIALCAGSIPRAAAALRISPSTIYRRFQARADKRAGVTSDPA